MSQISAIDNDCFGAVATTQGDRDGVTAVTETIASLVAATKKHAAAVRKYSVLAALSIVTCLDMIQVFGILANYLFNNGAHF